MKKDRIGEDEYITQLDNEFVADGLPQNEINKLLKMAEQELQCDKECERERKIKHFKKKWDYTKDLYKSLPNIISQNEEKYYKLDKGEFYYRNHILKEKYRNLIEKYKHQQLEKIKVFKHDTGVVLGNYRSAVLYKSRLKELYDDRMKLNKDLKSEINNSKKKITTDTRKIFYEDQEIDGLMGYRKFLYIVYYILIPILFVIYIIVSKFIQNKDYTNLKKLAVIGIFLLIYICFAIPLFLKKMVEILFSLWDFLSNIKL